jgi:hypothetical protein
MMFRWALLAAFAATACEDQLFDPSNPIDRIVVPKLRELGVPLRTASAAEVCRRMAIDLLGRAPTFDEMIACGKRDAGEMFDLFTARPEYLREQRRQWAQLVRFDNIFVRTEELVDLDRLVGALYADELSYREFATRR